MHYINLFKILKKYSEDASVNPEITSDDKKYVAAMILGISQDQVLQQVFENIETVYCCKV